MKKLMMVFAALLLAPAILSAGNLRKQAGQRAAFVQTEMQRLQNEFPQQSLLLTDLAAAHSQVAEYCNLEDVADNTTDITYYYKILFNSLENLSVQYARVKNASPELAHQVLPMLRNGYFVEESDAKLFSFAELKNMVEDVMNSWLEEDDRSIVVPADADLLAK